MPPSPKALSRHFPKLVAVKSHGPENDCICSLLALAGGQCAARMSREIRHSDSHNCTFPAPTFEGRSKKDFAQQTWHCTLAVVHGLMEHPLSKPLVP